MTANPLPSSVAGHFVDRPVRIAPDAALPPEARPAAERARAAQEAVEAAEATLSAASMELRRAQDGHARAVTAAATAGDELPSSDTALEAAEAVKEATRALEAAKAARGALVAAYTAETSKYAGRHLAGVRDRLADSRRRLDAALIDAAEAMHDIATELGGAAWLDGLRPNGWPTVTYRPHFALDLEKAWPSSATPSLEVLRDALLAAVDEGIAEALHEQVNKRLTVDRDALQEVRRPIDGAYV